MLWLIGGTSESREIAQLLFQYGIDYVVTVTTNEATVLYKDLLAKVNVGPLENSEIQDLLRRYGISKIVDASHPHAQVISQYAINLNLPYLRYERASVIGAKAKVFENIDSLINDSHLTGKRVLLTIGCKNLAKFKPWQDKAILFTRILPSLNSLTAAIDAGFASDRIIAIRPPVELELERALWKRWQIETVVTKANGNEDIKQQLSQELNIELLVLARPKVNYPRQCNQLEDVLHFCTNG
jgi:precorrin-6A/cobalt-precorrin-6A reductase